MIDKMREEFEAWYGTELRKIEAGMPEFTISAMRFNKEVLWQGWQASRDSLVIELAKPIPEWGTDNWGDGYKLAIKRCKDAIEAAGLKVKP